MATKSYTLVLSLALLTVFASASRPLWETKLDRNGNMKLGDSGNGMDSAKTSASFGMGIIPVPIPGMEGGYQFQMGPIGFVGNWSFGLLPPGSVISLDQRQPILVSPYLPPSSSMPATHQPLPLYYFPFVVDGSRQYPQGSDQMPTPEPEHN